MSKLTVRSLEIKKRQLVCEIHGGSHGIEPLRKYDVFGAEGAVN